MCKVIEDMLREEREEGFIEGFYLGLYEVRVARRMLEAGKYDFDEIAYISGLPLDEVQKLQAEQRV